MNQHVSPSIGLSLLLVVVTTACGASWSRDVSGSIPMMPIFDAERGFAGIVPNGCAQVAIGVWACEGLLAEGEPVVLIQHAIPMRMDALIQEVVGDTDLERLPEPRGALAGRVLRWELYTFETRIPEIEELMPGPLHIDLALAEGDGVSYLVGLAVAPESYARSERLCGTLFLHMVYSLTPWQGEGGASTARSTSAGPGGARYG
jgi:hypothetical protein